jgi:Lrp/AsnC family transcriptional regulator, leucine-responsive regulatory protein
MTESLDELDHRLVKALRRNARASVVDLAKELGVPRTTIVGRLRRLETQGVILRYTVLLDHKKLGDPVKAFIMIGFSPAEGRDQRQVARRIAQLPGVEEVSIISGEWDILVKIVAPSLEAIGDLVLDKVRREPGVARTVTLSSFATIKET